MRAVDKSLQHQEFSEREIISEKNLGNAENRTRGRWVRSKYAIHCAMQPPPPPPQVTATSSSSQKVAKSFSSRGNVYSGLISIGLLYQLSSLGTSCF